jgi:hypothetical protein
VFVAGPQAAIQTAAKVSMAILNIVFISHLLFLRSLLKARERLF